MFPPIDIMIEVVLISFEIDEDIIVQDAFMKI